LTAKLPLNAFDDLALNEIKHIIDVMRDADDDENEESTNTIKRAPVQTKSKKKSTENLDTNNNTLKYKTDDGTLKSKTEKNPNLSNGIPSVPKVHMGAGFMKIFNQCPLEIHASYCWINNETRDQLVLIAAEEGVYSLNLNELHDATLELVNICLFALFVVLFVFFSYIRDEQHGYLLKIISFGQYQVFIVKIDRILF